MSLHLIKKFLCSFKTPKGTHTTNKNVVTVSGTNLLLYTCNNLWSRCYSTKHQDNKPSQASNHILFLPRSLIPHTEPIHEYTVSDYIGLHTSLNHQFNHASLFSNEPFCIKHINNQYIHKWFVIPVQLPHAPLQKNPILLHTDVNWVAYESKNYRKQHPWKCLYALPIISNNRLKPSISSPSMHRRSMITLYTSLSGLHPPPSIFLSIPIAAPV